MVHPHLEHAEPRLTRHPREAERYAGMVVVDLERSMRAARLGPVERGEQGFLGAGLAHRTGDADDRRAAASATCAPEVVEPGTGVRHHPLRGGGTDERREGK